MATPLRLFISTGEVSGDLQAALLIEALWRQAVRLNLELEIIALGGDRMAAAGAKVLARTTAIGSVGLIESLPFVVPTWWVQRRARQFLRDSPPDVAVLIDYMGPNLAIGSFIRQRLPNLPLVYFIAPQEWVWSPLPQNTRRLVAIMDRLLAIFPQEARYFQNLGVNATWVGHPMVDRLEKVPERSPARASLGIAPHETAIALLPASRYQELRYLLPVMGEAAKLIQTHLPEVRFLIPLSLADFAAPMQKIIDAYHLRATLLFDRTLEAIAAADLAITKSGTVNLEIALLDVPQVVLYRVNPVTMWLGRHILKFAVPFISPANLVLMREIVPELLQEAATPEAIFREAMSLLQDKTRREQLQQDYQQMRRALGQPGACDRAAAEILAIAARSSGSPSANDYTSEARK